MTADSFTNGDNDQPITCPKCGSRTDFFEEKDSDGEYTEIHQCLNESCGYQFNMYYEETPDA